MPTSGVGMAKFTDIGTRNVDEGLLRRAWSNQIKYEALLSDPLFSIPGLTGQIDPGKSKATVPNKVFQDVTPEGDGKFARSVTLQLTKALSGSAKEGRNTDNVMGNEENIKLKYFNAFANDWGHGVTGQSYGIDFREMKPSQVYEKVKPLLSQWYGEYNGYSARHSVLYSVSPNLLQAPTSTQINANLGVGTALGAAPLNPNSYVMGSGDITLADSSAAYADQEAYEDAVKTALDAVAVGDAHLSIRKLLDLVDWAAESYIQPIVWEGYELYMLYAHPREFTNMLDPDVAGSFSKYWVDAASLGSGEMKKVIPGADFVVGDSIVVCRDRRVPAFGVDNTTITDPTVDGFVLPGRNDTRKSIDTTNYKKFYANMLFGESALVKFEPEAPTYRGQDDNYEKYNNVGYFGACSWMTPRWALNESVNTPADIQQEGSAIVYTAEDFT